MPLGLLPRKVADRRRCAICLTTFFFEQAHEIKFARNDVEGIIETEHQHSFGLQKDFVSLIRAMHIGRILYPCVCLFFKWVRGGQ